MQAAYDAARDLQERIVASGPVSASCAPLRRALVGYAAARVLEQEGVDRLSRTVRDRGRRRAEAARGRIPGAASGCTSSASPPAPAALALSPRSHEAFFGAVVADAPGGATSADIELDGTIVASAVVRGQRVRVAVSDVAPGSYGLTVVFRDAGGAEVGRSVSTGVQLLPAGARVSVPFRRVVPARAQRLARVLAGFDGIAGAWVQRLDDGTAAGANAGALFPAASTVKLGLLAGALGEIRGDPRRSPLFADLQAIAAWSSNLGSNRIVARLGSGCGTGADALAARGLRRLGARVSTFTGCYVVGTELQPAMPLAAGERPPPRDSRRLASPQDLARMMYAIHAAAVGAPGAQAQTGLTITRARLVLGLLLASEQSSDNAGLFAVGLEPETPVAQKNGWIRRVRLGAAIAYTDEGPVILSLAAYRPGGITLAQARALGRRVAEETR